MPYGQTDTKTMDEQKKVDREEFDKNRQRIDQAEANARRLKVEKDQLASDLEVQRAASAKLKAQIDELLVVNKSANDVNDELPDLDDDPELDDVAMAMRKTKAMLAKQAKELARLTALTANRENETAREKAARERKEENDRILNEVCEDLEEEFGSGLRNTAIELMEKMNADKGAPTSAASATLRLRKCFKLASEKPFTDDTDDRDDREFGDKGGGGGRPRFGPKKLKSGSLDEVAAQYES